MTIIEKSPTSLLIFVRRGDGCVQIYPGITKVDQDFHIDESLVLSKDHRYILNGEGEMYMLVNSSGVSSSNKSLQIIFENNYDTFKWIASKSEIIIEKTNSISNTVLDR